MEIKPGICYRYDAQPYGHLLIRKKSDRSFESLGLVDFKHPEVHTWKGDRLEHRWVVDPPEGMLLGETHDRLYVYARGCRRTAGWLDLENDLVLWQLNGAGPELPLGILNHGAF